MSAEADVKVSVEPDAQAFLNLEGSTIEAKIQSAVRSDRCVTRRSASRSKCAPARSRIPSIYANFPRDWKTVFQPKNTVFRWKTLQLEPLRPRPVEKARKTLWQQPPLRRKPAAAWKTGLHAWKTCGSPYNLSTGPENPFGGLENVLDVQVVSLLLPPLA